MGNSLQQNEAWFEARRGKFTGSNFKNLIGEGKAIIYNKDKECYLYKKVTKVVRKKDVDYLVPLFTDTGFNYIRKVVAERMGSYEIQSHSKACEWGSTYEAEAIEVYEERTGYTVEETGFIVHAKYDFTGCSTDGNIIGEKGIIEVKNPYNPANYIRYATDEAYILKEHGSQIYGNMWVSEASYCDFIAYDRRNTTMPIYINRFHRDEEKISQIEERVLLAEQVAQAMYNDIVNPNLEF